MRGDECVGWRNLHDLFKNSSGWESSDVTKTEGTLDKWYNATGIVSNDVYTGMMINATYGLRLAARNTTATATLTLNRTANTIVTIDAVWNVGSASSDLSTNIEDAITDSESFGSRSFSLWDDDEEVND